jgi:hypothetical protein
MPHNPQDYGSTAQSVFGSDATCSALNTDVTLVYTCLRELDLGHRFISPSPVATPATALDHGEDHDESCELQTPRSDNPRRHPRERGEIGKASVLFEKEAGP